MSSYRSALLTRWCKPGQRKMRDAHLKRSTKKPKRLVNTVKSRYNLRPRYNRDSAASSRSKDYVHIPDDWSFDSDSDFDEQMAAQRPIVQLSEEEAHQVMRDRDEIENFLQDFYKREREEKRDLDEEILKMQAEMDQADMEQEYDQRAFDREVARAREREEENYRSERELREKYERDYEHSDFDFSKYDENNYEQSDSDDYDDVFERDTVIVSRPSSPQQSRLESDIRDILRSQELLKGRLDQVLELVKEQSNLNRWVTNEFKDVWGSIAKDKRDFELEFRKASFERKCAAMEREAARKERERAQVERDAAERERQLAQAERETTLKERMMVKEAFKDDV